MPLPAWEEGQRYLWHYGEGSNSPYLEPQAEISQNWHAHALPQEERARNHGGVFLFSFFLVRFRDSLAGPRHLDARLCSSAPWGSRRKKDRQHQLQHHSHFHSAALLLLFVFHVCHCQPRPFPVGGASDCIPIYLPCLALPCPAYPR